MKKQFCIKIKAIIILTIIFFSQNKNYAQITGQNIGFTNNNYQNWTGYQGLANGISTLADLWTIYSDPATCYWQGSNCFVIYSSDTANDITVPGLKKVPTHLGYTHSSQINLKMPGGNVNKLSYDLDLTSSSSFITIAYALIMEEPGHPNYQNGTFRIEIVKLNSVTGLEEGLISPNAKIEYISNNNPLPNGWATFPGVYHPDVWLDWEQFSVNLSQYIGSKVRIKIILSSCSPTGHYAYGYVSAKVGTPNLLIDTSYIGDTLVSVEAPVGFQKYEWITRVNDISDMSSEFNIGPIIYRDSINTLYPNNPINNKLFINVNDIFANNQYVSVKLTSPKVGNNPSSEFYIKAKFPHSIIKASMCLGQTYNQNGFNVSSFGVHRRVIHLNGYDSIVFLQLSDKTIYDTIHASICNGFYTLNGFNVDTAGIYSKNYQASNGCDSIVTLNLTSNKIYNKIFGSICQGDTYLLNGFAESFSGVYTKKLVSYNGCDSIVYLYLNVNPKYNDTIFSVLCEGEVYNQNGFNADSSGLYTKLLQTNNGCDSIVTLNLKINQYPSVPNNLSVQLKPTYLEINWQGDATSYELYRYNSLIAIVNNTTYIDTNVVDMNSYCYKIKAKNGECSSDLSNEVCKSFVGLDNVSRNDGKLKLYPNPASSMVSLELEFLKNDADVYVYDINGRLVGSYKLLASQKKIDINLSNFSKGVYNIKLMNKDISITNQLIIE